MQPKNATKKASLTANLRGKNAGAFVCNAFDRARHSSAMRMRMHAEQADAAAAAL
ncbi:MAG TPA: hypothetical protein PKA81_02135 [Clostridia bacterium]|nr:hypothetical protein [Clostridia bacterium]